MATEYIVKHTELTAVADAIRAKAELTEGLEFPGGFIEAISAMGSKGFSVLVDDTFTLASAQTEAFTAYQSDKIANLKRYVLCVCQTEIARASSTYSVIMTEFMKCPVVITTSSGATNQPSADSSNTTTISTDGVVTLEPSSSAIPFRSGDFRLIVMGEVNE